MGGQCRGWPHVAFLSSALLGAFGRNGYFLAAAWMLAERGFGSAGVAAFLVIISAMEFVSSPVAGLLADRLDRRRLHVAADFGRFLASLVTAFTLIQMQAFLAICISAALFSFFDRLALTASQSMIPAMGMGGCDRVRWNSIVVLVMQLGNFGSALVTGFLLGGRSSTLLFFILGGFFALAAAVMASTRMPTVTTGVCPTKVAVWKVKSGFLPLVAVYAFFYASALLVSVLASSFVFAEQKGTAADFGLLEAAWSVGSLLGAVYLTAVKPGKNADLRHLCLLALTALVFMALPFAHTGLAPLLFASVGFLYNLGRVSVEVAFQSRVASESLGRAKGVMHSVAVALSLMVFGIAAAIGDRAFPSTIFFGFGVVLLIGITALAAVQGNPQQKDKS